jgi:hypothetical protein
MVRRSSVFQIPGARDDFPVCLCNLRTFQVNKAGMSALCSTYLQLKPKRISLRNIASFAETLDVSR